MLKIKNIFQNIFFKSLVSSVIALIWSHLIVIFLYIYTKMTDFESYIYILIIYIFLHIYINSKYTKWSFSIKNTIIPVLFSVIIIIPLLHFANYNYPHDSSVINCSPNYLWNLALLIEYYSLFFLIVLILYLLLNKYKLKRIFSNFIKSFFVFLFTILIIGTFLFSILSSFDSIKLETCKNKLKLDRGFLKQ